MKRLLSTLVIVACLAFANAQQVTPKDTAGKHETSASNRSDVRLKKDGTHDKRYKANQHLKKDGTPDKRYKRKG